MVDFDDRPPLYPIDRLNVKVVVVIMQSAMRNEALGCVKKIRERSFRGRSVIAVIGVQPATPGGHLGLAGHRESQQQEKKALHMKHCICMYVCVCVCVYVFDMPTNGRRRKGKRVNPPFPYRVD